MTLESRDTKHGVGIDGSHCVPSPAPPVPGTLPPVLAAEDWGIDEQTVRAAQRGDLLAADGLLTALYPRVIRVCRSIDPGTADDATQETLLIVFRKLSTLRDPQALRAWTNTIARRESIRLAVERQSLATEPLDDARLEHLANADDPEMQADLADLLSRLPPDERNVVELRHLADLRERDVAAALSLPVGTIKSRLHRARSMLRGTWR